MNIVDRRLNPQGKSLSNRQRFIRRARKELTDAVRQATAKRSLTDLGGADDKVWVKGERLSEPQIHHSSQGGQRDHVLPGNKQFEEGDRIKRPAQQGGGGQGSEAAEDGEGEDAFQFALSQEEFLDIFFDDLELPDLLRKQIKASDSFTQARAGHAISGSISNLNTKRTMRNSLSRRIALKRPRPAEIAESEAELAALDEAAEPDQTRRDELLLLLETQRRRSRRIPFIDPVDVRYNRFEQVPLPVTSAVMFCLMDVSGSMTEHMKDLAKRFYKLLYLFLTRRYKNVEIVFIRHTHLAREVDEETFFMSTDTGGTVVSTAFEEMLRVLAGRYPREQWNIYAAQASDGDNISADNAKVAALLKQKILPVCQYFAYIEVKAEGGRDVTTDLWRTYDQMVKAGAPIAMRRVSERSQIYPVFRDLFAAENQKPRAAHGP